MKENYMHVDIGASTHMCKHVYIGGHVNTGGLSTDWWYLRIPRAIVRSCSNKCVSDAQFLHACAHQDVEMAYNKDILHETENGGLDHTFRMRNWHWKSPLTTLGENRLIFQSLMLLQMSPSDVPLWWSVLLTVARQTKRKEFCKSLSDFFRQFNDFF